MKIKRLTYITLMVCVLLMMSHFIYEVSGGQNTARRGQAVRWWVTKAYYETPEESQVVFRGHIPVTLQVESRESVYHPIRYEMDVAFGEDTVREIDVTKNFWSITHQHRKVIAEVHESRIGKIGYVHSIRIAS